MELTTMQSGHPTTQQDLTMKAHQTLRQTLTHQRLQKPVAGVGPL
jgi:hypothetical protein